MKKIKEIKSKLIDAEEAMKTAKGLEVDRIASTIITLRWVLDMPIVQAPKDPVTGK